MSENREYVSRNLENGKVHISADVLTSMALMAVLEVEGVFSVNNFMSGRKNVGRSIRVVISEDNTISVDCYVIALYGHSVLEVAEAVQEAVTTALEAATACTVSAVNVSISGICHPKGSKK